MSDLLRRYGLRAWINAGGTLTRRGGAVASPEVAAAMAEAARLSLDSWELQAAASRCIAAATGAEAGLVITEKVGRVRTCTIGPSRLEAEMEWISRYRQVWDARFAALDRVIEQLESRDEPDVHTKRK